MKKKKKWKKKKPANGLSVKLNGFIEMLRIFSMTSPKGNY